ncbi:formate dehydrogenase subunit gamma [Pseudoxanthomonas sp.]|uniref:formate dehydrogenase subunit gamma n=1 Tax=Pseudoxanthomonas sp. TaxID=1871049 RepID=UPI002626442A|nr:formate dehydrogenase subunit gamma [Pseudoxanthomonas sp.]WDS37171.1 MAG: formate dehydrogenase subunit gamma [Pseudoxanthomonas sp.]
MGKRSRHIESVTEVVPVLDAGQVAPVEAAIAEHRMRPGALLPILHAVQDALGHVPEGAVAPIAAALNMTRADVHGVLSFYHHFRSAPPGRHVLQLCRAEACQSMGARGLESHARTRLGLSATAHHTDDGQFTVEPVYCLGNCALSPAMLLDGQLHGRITPARFDALVHACAHGVEHAA